MQWDTVHGWEDFRLKRLTNPALLDQQASAQPTELPVLYNLYAGQVYMFPPASLNMRIFLHPLFDLYYYGRGRYVVCGYGARGDGVCGEGGERAKSG